MPPDPLTAKARAALEWWPRLDLLDPPILVAAWIVLHRRLPDDPTPEPAFCRIRQARVDCGLCFASGEPFVAIAAHLDRGGVRLETFLIGANGERTPEVHLPTEFEAAGFAAWCLDHFHPDSRDLWQEVVRHAMRERTRGADRPHVLAILREAEEIGASLPESLPLLPL